MSSGNDFFASKKFKNIMKFVYGWGGAIVIIGALFKILHLKGADVMLIVGLLTEAFIFFISAFEPLHEDPDWTLVYPELALVHSELDDHVSLPDPGQDAASGSVTEQLDNMLMEAKIEPELIESLGQGLRNLSDSAKKMNGMSEASAATDEYIENLKGASSTVGKLSDAYESASSSLIQLTEGESEGERFSDQMQKVSGNLAALNNVYEMQLKGSREHLESTEKMYAGINELMTNLHDSIDDTRNYKQTIGELSRNLSALNTVYGNMLGAMRANNA